MGVRLGPEPFPKLYSCLAQDQGLENASFSIRTQVFYLPKFSGLSAEEILNSLQNMKVSLI